MFKPKCAPFSINDDGELQHHNVKEIQRGPSISYGNWILPCIWCQQKIYREELQERFQLMSDHLKLPNAESVDQIIESPEWSSFRKQLVSGKNLPKVCQDRCTSKT